VIVALSDLGVRCAAAHADLARLDALLIEGQSHCELSAPAAPRIVSTSSRSGARMMRQA